LKKPLKVLFNFVANCNINYIIRLFSSAKKALMLVEYQKSFSNY
jgi:hypothetical protein